MRIVRHRLEHHFHERSRDVGRPLEALTTIVLHYTAQGSGADSRDYMLLSPTEKQRLHGAPEKVYASAHVVVDRGGAVWQIVPFDRQARHAGRSRWRGRESVNRFSVGIEIANYGWLDRYGDGTFGRDDTPRFAAADVVLGRMPNGAEEKGWEPYAQVQLGAVEAVVRALLHRYPSIVDIVGHQDISPGRKFDPGPAFPMARFRELLHSRGFGAVPESPRPPLRLRSIAPLNMRGGAGTDYDRLSGSPLPTGTAFVELEVRGEWVRVQPEGDRPMCWVHGDYVTPIPEDTA